MLKRTTLAFLLALAAALPAQAQAQDKTITMFAAASMKNAIDDIDAAFTKATGIKAVASLAASSALAKQIEQGAPADVFASADLDWMDYLEKKNLIKNDTPREPARQQAGADRAEGFQARQRQDRAGLRHRQARRRRPHRGGRRARGAGRQIRQGGAGEARRHGPRRRPSSHRRRTCARRWRWSARGEAPLGIVYETDAKIEKNVKIVGYFPDGSYPPITYPVALTANAKPEAAQYLDFLRSNLAKTIFETYGFSFLIKPVS